MDNTKLIFIGEDRLAEMQVYNNGKKSLFIEIKRPKSGLLPEYIELNKATAIKFSKELKKQISLLNY